MRAAALKDADLFARLDSELKQLDFDTAAACAKLGRTEIEFNGMPEQNTAVVVKRRRVEPAGGLSAARLQELISKRGKGVKQIRQTTP